MTALTAAALACALAAAVPSALRWLRVAQREHYLPGWVSRFARRWWTCRPLNVAAALAGATGAIGAIFLPPAALAAAAAVAAFPLGLGVRGRTAALAWTRRLRSLAAVVAVLVVAAAAVGAGVAGLGGATAAAALAAVAMPLLVDAALALSAPAEQRLAARYVAEAQRRLAAVGPRVVAITGSYGKTSTKGYVAHLLGGRYAVAASPRSFNNRAGLARTVNETLQPGTEILIAEMGMFGPGEIAALCAWMPPEIAVITAVGPVHLERLGSLEAILEAKAEITATAEVCVLNVDDERLATLASRLAGDGRIVIRCSGGGRRAASADVVVRRAGDTLMLRVAGKDVGAAERVPGASPVLASNVACAVGAAIAIGLAPKDALARLADLPGAPNRLAVERSPSGVTVIDDTYNSNPAGAAAALETLAGLGSGRRVVVTPGMVELGRLQEEENARLGEQALRSADALVVVGRTNRAALLRGAVAAARGQSAGLPRIVKVERRAAAVEWVRRELREGDAVLYENDLPDHFP